MVMIPELMSRATCCKNIILSNRNESFHVFMLIDFPEFAIKQSHRENFNFISENLGRYNQDDQGIFNLNSSYRFIC